MSECPQSRHQVLNPVRLWPANNIKIKTKHMTDTCYLPQATLTECVKDVQSHSTNFPLHFPHRYYKKKHCCFYHIAYYSEIYQKLSIINSLRKQKKIEQKTCFFTNPWLLILLFFNLFTAKLVNHTTKSLFFPQPIKTKGICRLLAHKIAPKQQ